MVPLLYGLQRRHDSMMMVTKDKGWRAQAIEPVQLQQEEDTEDTEGDILAPR